MEYSNDEHPCIISTSSLEDNIVDYPFPEHSTQLTVTAVLIYCKRKILNPYLRVLSIVGLRPLISNHIRTCFQILNHIYTIQIICLLIFGYLLQYMACFRRDRGFCFKLVDTPRHPETELSKIYEQICHAPILFSFIIPSALHLLGYLYAVGIIRYSDDDQLPVLMERVFLASTNLSRGSTKQRKVVRILWVFVGLTGVWMAISLITVCIMLTNGTINFKWIETYKDYIGVSCLKGLLIVCTFWHDIVQATIISNYCLQVQLLTVYLQFLKEKLLMHPIQPIEWIRHIENFKKMLRYINNDLAPPVCIFTFINITWTISGLLWLFNFDVVDKETTPIVGISTINVILWLLLSLAPAVQASRLSNECELLRSAGQEVRTRPLVHQDTPRYDLDSILLYTASLKLRAKMFYMPITGRYLSLFFLLVGICIVVLGQCHFFSA